MTKLSSWTEEESKDRSKKLLKKGMSSELTEFNLVESFTKNFTSKKSFQGLNVQLLNDPFQVTIIDHFLADESQIPKLITEMESIEWTRKQMDLYEFYQTTDLANVCSPQLAEFYKFLNNDVLNWMQQLTGMKFKKISASCSMYNCGDFLLTHDDLLSDRLIAFVFYLSPWKGKNRWDKSMGGALELFKTDRDGQPKFPVVKKIQPSNNQFVFFKVEKKSYHQVSEVLSKEFPRLTINGWFHGFKDNADFDAAAFKVKTPNVPLFKAPNEAANELSCFICKNYLKDSIKISIQKQIEENSEAALGEFLVKQLYDEVVKELQDKKTKWIKKGPSHQQNYESLNTGELRAKSCTKRLMEILSSKPMFKLLHEYTELDLHGTKAKKPKCSIELQRWQGGSYTLIGDPSTYNNDTLDLILYFGSNDNVGVITYLTPEEDSVDALSVTSSEGEVEPVLLTIFPQSNFLNIIYRSSGTAKFTKYCSKSTIMETEFNYILFCSYKE